VLSAQFIPRRLGGLWLRRALAEEPGKAAGDAPGQISGIFLCIRRQFYSILDRLRGLDPEPYFLKSH
jgi:hypothetical protein